MTGLMMKDALVMRKTLRLYALFLLFYSGLAVLGVFPMSMALAMVEVIVMVLPISSFSYDEAAKWDRYAAVLPVGRTAVVKAHLADHRYGTPVHLCGSGADECQLDFDLCRTDDGRCHFRSVLFCFPLRLPVDPVAGKEGSQSKGSIIGKIRTKSSPFCGLLFLMALD